MSSGCWTFYDAFKSKARKRTVCEHNFVKKKKPVKRDVCVFHIYIYDVSFSDLLSDLLSDIYFFSAKGIRNVLCCILWRWRRQYLCCLPFQLMTQTVSCFRLHLCTVLFSRFQFSSTFSRPCVSVLFEREVTTAFRVKWNTRRQDCEENPLCRNTEWLMGRAFIQPCPPRQGPPMRKKDMTTWKRQPLERCRAKWLACVTENSFRDLESSLPVSQFL